MSRQKLEYVRGGHIHACATSLVIKTGGWRVFTPIVDEEKCNRCRLCVWFCPENCVRLTDTAVEIDYDYCKGCGICAHECPKRAIAMKREGG